MAEPPVYRQLPLAFRFGVRATFANFVITADTAPVVHALRNWLVQPEGGVFYLAGPRGCGRTHLVQAAAVEHDGWILPLADLAANPPAAVLEGLDEAPLLCLDDIDAVTADAAWCEALFGLFNRMRDRGRYLLVSARAAPPQLPCALADLRSRLAWGGVYRLAPLDDEGRRRLLTQRAGELGLRLSDEVVAYLLSHFPRSSRDLLELVEKLDDLSLVRKRQVTVPLVRQLIELRGGSASPSQ